MWSVLGTLLLVIVSVALTVGVLFLLALTLPMRVGLSARADRGFDQATAGLRLYGGLLGVGVRVRGASGDSAPFAIAIGIMAWRTFRPIRTISADRELVEDLTPAGPQESEGSPGDAGGPEPADENGAPEVRETEPEAASEVTQPEDEKPPAETEPTAKGTEARVEDRLPSEEPEPVSSDVESPTPMTPKEAASAPKAPRRNEIREKLEMLRAAWNEWSPLALGALRRLRGVLRLRLFRVRGYVGTGDPALTGLVLAAAHGLRGLEGGALALDLEGEFNEIRASGTVEAEWKISLIRIWSAALFVGWALFRRWRTARRESRQEG